MKLKVRVKNVGANSIRERLAFYGVNKVGKTMLGTSPNATRNLKRSNPDLLMLGTSPNATIMMRCLVEEM